MHRYKVEDCPPVFSAYGRETTGLPRQPGCRWFVARTKSQMDSRLAFELTALKISHFVPQQCVPYKFKGVVTTRMQLLIPGFVFVLSSWEDLHRVWDTRRIWHVIKTNDQVGIRQDLRRFAKFVKMLVFDKFEAITPGRRIRFIAGHPLAGEEAIVDARDGNRVALDIRMLGCVSFKTEAKYLEVVKCR